MNKRPHEEGSLYSNRRCTGMNQVQIDWTYKRASTRHRHLTTKATAHVCQFVCVGGQYMGREAPGSVRSFDEPRTATVLESSLYLDEFLVFLKHEDDKLSVCRTRSQSPTA